MIITVDGPAASGKGVLARALAEKFGLRHLDSGRLYRATAARMLAAGLDTANLDQACAMARTLDPQEVCRPRTGPGQAGVPDDLATAQIGNLTSKIAVHGALRTIITAHCRSFARLSPRGVVADGRDAGTHIFPDATVKIFLTASPAARARRRYREFVTSRQAGQDLTYDAVLAQIQERDQRDTTRSAAPLQPAPSSHIIDTTDMSINSVLNAAGEIVHAAQAGNGHCHAIKGQ